MIYLVAGLIIGFFVALPVGASAVMCINRTLQYGLLSGLLTGFGVALADLVYGVIAVFGLLPLVHEDDATPDTGLLRSVSHPEEIIRNIATSWAEMGSILANSGASATLDEPLRGES